MDELARAAIHRTRRAAGIGLGILSVGAFTVSVLLLVASLTLEPEHPNGR